MSMVNYSNRYTHHQYKKHYQLCILLQIWGDYHPYICHPSSKKSTHGGNSKRLCGSASFASSAYRPIVTMAWGEVHIICVYIYICVYRKMNVWICNINTKYV